MANPLDSKNVLITGLKIELASQLVLEIAKTIMRPREKLSFTIIHTGVEDQP
jgi:hypothetical protein